jgi:uncharacterized protein (TIGR00297 family)
MYLLDAFDPGRAAGIFENPWTVAAAALLTGILLAFAYHKRLAELPLVIVAWFLGFFMLLLVNLSGFILLGVYFAVRYLLTVQIGERPRKGRTKGKGYEAWDVAVTVGLALIFAFWSRVTEYEGFFLVAMAAALATALADTAAAELGQLYGGRPYTLPSFQRVPPGTPGAVSLAGTFYGIVAALVVAFVAWILNLVPGPVYVPVITLAAFLGIVWESGFGPSLTRRGIGPHTLNLLCTLAGSLAVMVLYWLVG